MGSKQRLLTAIAQAAEFSQASTFVDAFSGSGCVSHRAKSLGYNVVSNDALVMCATWTRAAVENSTRRLDPGHAEALLAPRQTSDDFIRRTFGGLFFSDNENQLLDDFSAHVRELADPAGRAIALAAMARACLKRRPRGVFTYVGHRYDDGRADLRRSLRDHFLDSVERWNAAVFDNGTICVSQQGSAMALNLVSAEKALVYLDPPYFSLRSDNDYARRYHFVEGLMTYWAHVVVQPETKTKKFRSPYREFQTRRDAYESLATLIARLDRHDVLISYSSNCLPTREELTAMLTERNREVEVREIDHTYSFGTHGHKLGNANNRVREYLFCSPARE